MILKYGQGHTEDKTAMFRAAAEANAMRGGENVATGALIGAMLGGACGFSNLPKDLVRGLAPSQREQIRLEVDAFVANSPLCKL